MRRRFPWRTFALFVCVIAVVGIVVSAQAPSTNKRPLTYDVVDYWKSIPSSKLSNDGKWLAYSVTSQAEDGELVVRNLATGQEFRHPRGTGATFTEDGRFLIFSIAQTKTEEEKERVATEAAGATGTGGEQTAGAGRGTSGRQAGGGQAAAAATAVQTTGGGQTAAAGQTTGRAGRSGRGGTGGGQTARNEPRTGMGVMTLADGKVTTVEKVGSFRVPDESSSWLAYYKGTGGAGGGGGRGGGRGGRGAGAAPAPAAGGRGGTAAQTTATGERRKDPGSDLILRNLATGEEKTIPEVSEYLFDTKGIWLAYATSSTDAAKDGAFLRHLSDGTIKTLLSGQGHYKSLSFDEAGQQVVFLSDAFEYDKPVSPYRLYYWKAADATPTKAGAAAKPATVVAKPAAPAMPAPEAAKPAVPAVAAKPAPEAAKPAVPAAAGEAAKPAAGGQAATGAAAEQAAPAKPVHVPPTGDAIELVSGVTTGMPKGMVVADFAPRFSRDGARIFLATGNPPAAPADPDNKPPALIQVDLWSSKDPIIQPMQKVRAEQERSRNYRAVVHLADKKFVQLATPELPTVNQGDDAVRAIGTSDLPYRMEISWDQAYNDVYLVDLKTGAPKQVLEHWGGSGTAMSPGGKYVIYFDERAGHWWTYRIADGARINLTEKLKVRFQQDPTTPDLPGPYGVGGWTANDQSVLLYDEFDIWEIKPDGSGARMITNGEGRKQDLVFRYRSLDPEERVVPAAKPMLLSATNDRTKAMGFYRMAPVDPPPPEKAGTPVKASGAASRITKAEPTASLVLFFAAPEKITMLDKAIGALAKASKGETIVFTLSRFEEFPDLWTSSDINFRDMKKISNANPQQSEFVWGRSELVDYINADGKRLRAILTKPDNFDPAKKYPLMVYIYEGLTQNLHSYAAPGVRHTINVARYVSNGYVILQPDIVYDTGFPGESAEKCVIPAVNTVVAMGYIDPKRIGIEGHSWGGYQITHLITRTDMFAAVEAGASVSNMISAYGGIRWGTGMVREFQYEKTQSRIGAAPWDAPLLYIENSPIFWVKKIKTPYLTIHNDADDAVPWYQGIEFNTAMRRLGKEAYMFTYNGEPHGLTNRDNMKHFTVHMDEFFDHYLLGKPRPEWMDKGVSFLDKGKRDVLPMFKKKGAEKAVAK
ncbi:MAG: prolyl oligopeptidase family serine peptidase [Acidobacteria bacterium]|nr:prolyl oligopeptidase family serine peptidase [Acidobacteriota bacterium]